MTRKITRALGRIKMGLQEKLFLGTWRRAAIGAMPAITSRPCG